MFGKSTFLSHGRFRLLVKWWVTKVSKETSLQKDPLLWLGNTRSFIPEYIREFLGGKESFVVG